MNILSCYEHGYIADFGLKVIDEFSDVLDKKWPRIDQKYSIHHHNNETISVVELKN